MRAPPSPCRCATHPQALTRRPTGRFAYRSLSRTPAARLPLARQPLACHSPVARQCCMSGAPPAARQPSASCSLAPCQLRALAAHQSLASPSSVALHRRLFRCCHSRFLLQVRGGPLPDFSACCSGDARFDSGLVTLASSCQLRAYLIQVRAACVVAKCQLFVSVLSREFVFFDVFLSTLCPPARY